MPFSAPLTDSLTSSVKVEGVEAAVQGSSGLNTPAHVGLHTSDPQFKPTDQEAELTKGSGTVFFDGKPAAYNGCQARICAFRQGSATGTAATVLVGS